MTIIILLFVNLTRKFNYKGSGNDKLPLEASAVFEIFFMLHTQCEL